MYRCLAALAEWNKLTRECRKEWKYDDPHVRREMASLAAHAAWHMGQWDDMANYTNEMQTSNTSTGTFLNAVLAVHNQNLDAAKGMLLLLFARISGFWKDILLKYVHTMHNWKPHWLCSLDAYLLANFPYRERYACKLPSCLEIPYSPLMLVTW